MSSGLSAYDTSTIGLHEQNNLITGCIGGFPVICAWKGTQCWQRGQFAKLLGRFYRRVRSALTLSARKDIL